MAHMWTGLLNWRDSQQHEALKALYKDMSKEEKVDIGTKRTYTALRAVALTRHPTTAAIGYVMAMKEAVRAGCAGCAGCVGHFVFMIDLVTTGARDAVSAGSDDPAGHFDLYFNSQS